MSGILLRKGIFIVGAKRTPFGAFGGKLKDKTPTDLLEIASKHALAQSLDGSKVDTVIVGNVAQTAADTCYIARHVGIRCGVPLTKPALTVNRLCGSGFQAAASGAQEIELGLAEVSLTGGSDNMSMAPYQLRGTAARFGTRLGSDMKLEDSLWSTLTDLQIQTPMGVTAENLAKKYGISREECDAFALQSQKRWAQAHADGRFVSEIVPIEVKGKRGKEEMTVDEHPKPQSTIESLSKLPPVFGKDGVTTAANASGICDGAGAIVLASDSAVEKHSLKPLARLRAFSYVGCEPSIMGIGPAPAIRLLLEKAGLTLADIGLFDINEAFAAQFLAVQKELSLDESILNVNGGAIALGHPVGASGSRILANLTYEMGHRNVRYAVGAACIGGGQGIAVLLEKC